MSELRVRHPYEYFTRGNTIRANLESTKRHRYDYTPDYDAGSFELPGAVQDWLDTEFAQEVCSAGATCSLRSRSYGRYSRPRCDLVGDILILI